MGSIHEIKKFKKSSDTVPLNSIISVRRVEFLVASIQIKPTYMYREKPDPVTENAALACLRIC